MGGGEGGGGSPGGATNVFEAEPDEDRDIDDEGDPPGWDIPVKPPPPGAWVVARQKEEGEAGLAGMAGDTYLLKKMSQEVKRLNRMYLVLIPLTTSIPVARKKRNKNSKKKRWKNPSGRGCCGMSRAARFQEKSWQSSPK